MSKIYYLQSAEDNIEGINPLPSTMPNNDAEQFKQFLDLSSDSKNFKKQIGRYVYFKFFNQEDYLSRYMDQPRYRYYRLNDNSVNEIFVDELPSEDIIKQGTIKTPEGLELEYLSARIVQKEKKEGKKKILTNKKKKLTNKKRKSTNKKKKSTNKKRKSTNKKKKSTNKK